MSGSANPPASQAPTRAPATPRSFRLGITPRLAFSVLAVTVLAIAANVIAEHAASIIETTRIRMRTVTSGPSIRGQERQTEQANAATAIASATAFVSALDQADRSFRDRVDADDAASGAALSRALAAFTQQTLAYVRERGGAGGGDRVGRISQLAGAYRDDGTAAVMLADRKRALREAYRTRMGAVDGELKGAIDRSWKIFGRVFARQSLINLSRELEELRRDTEAIAANPRFEDAAVATIVADEALLQSTLEQGEAGLSRSKGEHWVNDTRTAFQDLVTDRVALVATADALRSALDRLTRHRDQLSRTARLYASEPVGGTGTPKVSAPAARIEPQSPTPGPGTVGEPPVERSVTSIAPTDETRKLRLWVLWTTVVVLASMVAMSLSTIFSIVRPVRRLVDATRRLSAGGAVQVSRGGIKEIDDLAEAFNHMAEQLAVSREATRVNQAKLEDRVQERTRSLKHLAEHDALTGLPNRRQLFSRLNDSLARAVVSGQHVGVLFIDLDNFKNVNDSMGHGFGDRVLQSVARRLSEASAVGAFAARLGGDEFTVVFTGTASTSAIVDAGHAICRAFQQPIEVGNRQLNMSVSIGVAVYPDHEQDAGALLRAADAALFRAKALGRSQLSVFSPDLVDLARSKFSIEQGLRLAVERGEFELVFQPQVCLRSCETTLVEALLRWRTPSGTHLAPSEFLAVAEESGLILEISNWVLRTAVAKAAEWYYGAWPNVCVAINVSPRQLLERDFVDRVQTLLSQHRLPATSIEFELTENVLQTGPATIAALQRLRGLGVAIALDDFGTGYSSLASLELLPLRRVKLDRSLIAGIATSTSSRAIASAIIGLCHNLGLEVTAEGVERPEQLTMLSGKAAVHVQGYLLARPVSSDALLPELAQLPARVKALLAVPAAFTGAQEAARAPGASVTRLGLR